MSPPRQEQKEPTSRNRKENGGSDLSSIILPGPTVTFEFPINGGIDSEGEEVDASKDIVECFGLHRVGDEESDELDSGRDGCANAEDSGFS
jgi:hypothetical protein